MRTAVFTIDLSTKKSTQVSTDSTINTPQLADSLLKPTSVLTSNIVMQISNVPFESTWNYALYLMGFLLLVISLIMIVAIRWLQRKGAQA